MPIDEQEHDEFEALLAEKRHKELSGTLKNIALSLSQNKDKEIVAAIEKQVLATEKHISSSEKFSEKLLELEKRETKIDVEVNHEAIIQSNRDVRDELREVKGLLITLTKDRKTVFKVARIHGGIIDEITAIQSIIK